MAKEAVAQSKCLTKWKVFEDVQFYPTQIWCQWFKESPNITDESCHTRIPAKIANILNHASTHGGDFIITFARSSKVWPGWKELAEKGIECQVLACDSCGARLPINANHILEHFRVHADFNRRRKDNKAYRLTLGSGVRLSEDADDNPDLE